LVEVTSLIITSSSAPSSVDSREMPEEEMDGVVGSAWAFERAFTVSGLLGARAEVVIMRAFLPVPVTDGVVWANSVASTDTGEGRAVSEGVAIYSWMILAATESQIFFGLSNVVGLVGGS
jgi:hypothetical protein